MQHRWFRVFTQWCVPRSSTLLSPGARCSSPSLSWISKSIRWLSFGGFHSRRPRQCETTPWAEGEKKRCGSASDVFHLPHSSCSEVLTHTHAQACCPPPMTTSWPHSSHLLLRPWLTCPPKRKISRPLHKRSLKPHRSKCYLERYIP